VLDYLAGDGCWRGTLSTILRNPAQPDTVVAALAARAKEEARARIARHVLRDRENVPRLIASAAAITPAELAKAVDGLRYGWNTARIPTQRGGRWRRSCARSLPRLRPDALTGLPSECPAV